MMHGPCGKYNPKCGCMRKKDGKKSFCRFNYPKELSDHTIFTNEDTFMYKRPNNGRYVIKNGINMGNEWVAPYCAYLLKRFKCHINLEKCASSAAIKYLFKYIYKGFDKTEMDLGNVTKNALGQEIDPEIYKFDEITKHADFRYISSCEAAWRIFEFPLQGKSHHIERLEIHLPNEHVLTLDEENPPQDENDPIFQLDSKLTAYFKYNAKLAPKDRLLYQNIPKECTWQKVVKQV